MSNKLELGIPTEDTRVANSLLNNLIALNKNVSSVPNDGFCVLELPKSNTTIHESQNISST